MQGFYEKNGLMKTEADTTFEAQTTNVCMRFTTDSVVRAVKDNLFENIILLPNYDRSWSCDQENTRKQHSHFYWTWESFLQSLGETYSQISSDLNKMISKI